MVVCGFLTGVSTERVTLQANRKIYFARVKKTKHGGFQFGDDNDWRVQLKNTVLKKAASGIVHSKQTSNCQCWLAQQHLVRWNHNRWSQLRGASSDHSQCSFRMRCRRWVQQVSCHANKAKQNNIMRSNERQQKQAPPTSITPKVCTLVGPKRLNMGPNMGHFQKKKEINLSINFSWEPRARNPNMEGGD